MYCTDIKASRVGVMQVLVMCLMISAPQLINALEPVSDELGVVPRAGGAFGPDEQQPAVYDLSMHDLQEMQLLLERLDQLAQQPSAQSQSARIALVLHGPELKYFTIRNYAMHRELVDLAAKLDAFQVIEVKACNTMMRQLGLQEADMPAFIEIVPYGPNEIRRLVGTGYLKM